MSCKINPIAVAAALLIAIAPTTTHAQQVKHWRVIAMSNSTDQSINITTDSTIFVYSPGSLRGSTYNNDRISYDSAARYFFDGSRNRFVPYKVYNKEYASTGDDMVELRVRSRPQHSPYNSLYTSELIDSIIYDASGRVLREVNYRRWWSGTYADPFSRCTYRYDANGNVIEKYIEYAEPPINQTNAGPLYKPGGYNFYTYDANGNLLRDSASKFHGNIGGWMYHGEVNYTYDAQGNISEEHAVDSTSSNVYHKYYRHSSSGVLVYDSTLMYVTTSLGYADTNIEAHYYIYGSNGLIARDSMHTNYGVYMSVPLGKSFKDYTYTPFNFVDNVVQQVYKRNTNTYSYDPYGMIQYYYEPYYFPVSTASVSAASELVAYPVPSSNFINIKWEVAKPTKLDARIVNIQGQTVRQWSDNADGVYYKSINVGELSAGNYYIVIVANGEKIEKKITVVK